MVAIAINAAGQTEAPKAAQDRTPNPALAPIEDVAGLPRVLLIGDSISIGYTLPVRELLKDKANVHRPSTNCGPTTRGLTGIDAWLGQGKWDVIHFNWGLHDLKYMGSKDENLADPAMEGSHQQVPIEAYEANLRQLVARLKQTGAVLIWATTTPVPQGTKGRIAGDEARYNEVAAKVMAENQVLIDDLCGLARGFPAGMQLEANVHFSREGYEALAKQVASQIEACLDKVLAPAQP